MEASPCSPSLPIANGNVLELEETSNNDTSSRILQTITEFRESRKVEDGLKEQRRWQVLLFGQAIAIAAASVNASSYTLEYNLGVVLPIFQMSIMYMILTSYLCCCRDDDDEEEEGEDKLRDAHDETSVGTCAPQHSPSAAYTLPLLKLKLRIPWWIYFLISLLDVEANYMVLLSLRFTSLTSTTLLGSLTVPSVMICSRFLLARIFSLHHYIGVCLCLLGGTAMVWSDLGGGNDQVDDERTHSYVGDLLAICAALLYGLGDTVAEYAIKHINRAEYLGMLGLFGFLISSLQFVLVEWNALLEFVWYTAPTRQGQVVATMVWYIASLVFYYVAASYFLTRSDATLLNLSLQTTSLWACVFSVMTDGAVPPAVFFAAVALVTLGVCVYEIGGKAVPAVDEEDTSSDDDESEKLKSANNHNEQLGYMSIEI